jgi:hypothetical protein
MPDAVEWSAVWPTVAEVLAEDIFVPQFLTEDGIRTVTLRVLGTHIDVVQCAEIEYPAANLGGDRLGRLDMIIRLGAAVTVIEFKYPREPRQKLPPWPDHLGGVLSDTYRLGILSASRSTGKSIQVLLAGALFLGYTERTLRRLGLGSFSQGSPMPREITLSPSTTPGLAETTRRHLKERDRSWRVIAACTSQSEVRGKDLWLGVYEVTATAV